ncbi:MAG: GIY-YIG nuclease family protein [Acidobacteria bacterium]|nr:GIY-YIG nuclease family protein [Acidobacteriota bacterium]
MYFCYILQCFDSSFYVGITDDPARRLKDHNNGKGAKYTAARRPLRMVWTEEHPNHSSALRREAQIKRWSHQKKAALAAGFPRLRA